MPIRFPCEHCGRILGGQDQLAGREIPCPSCGQTTRVEPMAEPPAPPAPESAEPGAPPASDDQTAPPAPSSQQRAPSSVDVAEEPERVTFTSKRDMGGDLDMTPMVDVTFLLLIFFMVTAAFALQKSIEVPPPDREESAQARTIQEIEEDDDYVIVRIDSDNTVWVDEREAPTKQEVLVKLREAREGRSGSRGPRRLLVLADREASHNALIMALDAGNAVGMESLRMSIVDEDDF